MSVINQMLRDLDQRSPSSDAPGLDKALHQGTRSVEVPTRPRPSRPGRKVWLVTAAAMGMALALGAWYGGYLTLPDGAARPLADAASPSKPPSAPGAEAAAPVPTTVAPDLPVSLRLEAQLEHPPVRTPAAAVPASSAAIKPSKSAAAPERVDAPVAAPTQQAATPTAVVHPTEKPMPSPAPAVAAAPAPATSTAPPDTAQQAQRQGAAARDALAQAQSLWNAGNPGAATELLRDAVQMALRAVPASTPLDGGQALMVREMLRMQMGSGHVPEAHEWLVHNETRYKAHAELWAMRANAAQRLGLHPDSVQSYTQALQFRPNEQRWLLGLAVSLAAMGQTAAANGVVERARTEGPIAREIADYLRQLGVTVK